jgi:hypothetical protein
MKLARWHLWSPWINANAFAELIGLGTLVGLIHGLALMKLMPLPDQTQ